MDIRDPEIIELVNQIEELEKKLYAHPLHKVCENDLILFPFQLVLNLMFLIFDFEGFLNHFTTL